MNLHQVEHILFPTDLSENSLNALQWAVELAQWHQAVLHVIHVIPTSPLHQLRDLEVNNAKSDWDNSMAQFLDKSVPASLVNQERFRSAVLTNYSVADEIIEYSQQHHIDLMIIGTHGRSSFPNPTLLGGTAGKILHRSNIPVLTWRLTEQHRQWSIPSHILAPVDFSDQSVETLGIAKQWAAHYNASLSLLYVAEEQIVPVFNDTLTPAVFVMKLDDEQIERASSALEKLFKSAKGPEANASFNVRQGHPAQEILEFTNSKEVDLVIMSSHGHRGLTLFTIGSTAERVVHKVPCSVLIQKPVDSGKHQE